MEICLCWSHTQSYIMKLFSLTLSLSVTQSIYRQCPEKIRCSQSDTSSERVRETNMQLSVCCRRPGVRIDAAELLLSSLVPLLSVQGRRPETHTGLKVVHLQCCNHWTPLHYCGRITPASGCVFRWISLYWSISDIVFLHVSSLQTSLPPRCSTSADQWTTCVLHGW